MRAHSLRSVASARCSCCRVCARHSRLGAERGSRADKVIRARQHPAPCKYITNIGDGTHHAPASAGFGTNSEMSFHVHIPLNTRPPWALGFWGTGCSVTTRVHLGGTEPPRSPHRSGQAAIRGCIRCCRGATTDALPFLGCLTWRYALTIGEDVGLSAVLATKSPIEVRSVFLAWG